MIRIVVCALGMLGLLATGCGASSPPERESTLVTIVAPGSISSPAAELGGRHLVLTPTALDGAAAQRVYVHLGQRGTTPVAADPVWRIMSTAGARVVVLAYHPVEPDEVDPASTAVDQLSALLSHLADTAPADGWDTFVEGNEPVWDKIIIAGNRDGADHALTIANDHDVARAVFFSGPLNPAEPTGAAADRFAVGHAADMLTERQATWDAAGVGAGQETLDDPADLDNLGNGPRFVSDLALVDGFNERNDWQHPRYSPLWEFLCCQ